jgi:hypothetical protein
MTTGPLSPQELQQWQREGYLCVTGLLDAEEVDLLRRSAKEDKQLDEHSYGKADGEGGNVRMSLWNHPGNNIYGTIARSERVVRRMEQLLGDEVYHYHSKMILKDPKVGGAWEWHQDYGYWYQNGVLSPDLASVMIAVDPATQLNGCLQVIPGSHRLGRIDHGLTGDQAGADSERMAVILQRFPVVHCALNPGDALFFHSNLLHRSDQNKSDQPRWTLICCYNAKSNDPYKDSHHPRYTPLHVVPDEEVKRVGVKRFEAGEDVAWLNPSADASATNLKQS